VKLRQRWIWTPLAAAAFAVASYLLYAALQPPGLPAGIVYGSGHVEATEISVAAEVSGRVRESRLIEGRRVGQGDVLVRLADADLRKRLVQAEASLAAVGEQVAALRAKLGTARHHLETAKTEFERARKLRADGAVSAQRLDQTEDAYFEARGQVQALEKQLELARRRVEVARAEVALARQQLEKTVIRAPGAGTVLVKAIEPGELAVPGRVIAVLADLARLELRIFLPENVVGKVNLGDSARVRVDAFPDRFFEATVARIDQRAQFTPRDIHTPEERVRMVFGVTLTLANPERYLKPGMPADAWVRVNPATPWPERLVVPQ
jgi:HlyD family secretion protein